VTDNDVAFVKHCHSHDDLTERLGEEAVSAMTSGESHLADDWDKALEEESGGPFVETGGRDEFAEGTDASNIGEATREPFPMTSSSISPERDFVDAVSGDREQTVSESQDDEPSQRRWFLTNPT